MHSAWRQLAPMLPLTEIIDFLDLQTLMKLYGKIDMVRLKTASIYPSIHQLIHRCLLSIPVCPFHVYHIPARTHTYIHAAPFVLWPSFVSHITNVKKADLRKVLNNVEKVPTKALKDLATAFHEDGLMIDFEDGKGPQRLGQMLSTVKHPVLCIAADFDKQCTIAAIRKTLEVGKAWLMSPAAMHA